MQTINTHKHLNKRQHVIFEAQVEGARSIRLSFATTDEDEGIVEKELESIGIITIIRSEKKFERELTNRTLSYFPSRQVGAVAIRKQFEYTFPVTHVHWSELESDQALTKLVFYGLGQQYLQRVGAGGSDSWTWGLGCLHVPVEAWYEVDLSNLGKYRTRPKYATYGVGE